MAIGLAPFVGGVVGGFNQGSEAIRQRNFEEDQRQKDRDSKVFDALANSDDPDIRAAAVTGLLTGNHPARGMDKFFNKAQDHPAYEQIRDLVSAGHQPFLGKAEQAGAVTAAQHRGQIVGAGQGFQELTGNPPSEELATTLASPWAVRGQVPGNAEVYNPDTGEWENRVVSEHAGQFIDNQTNEPITQPMRNFRRNAPNPTAGRGAGVKSLQAKPVWVDGKAAPGGGAYQAVFDPTPTDENPGGVWRVNGQVIEQNRLSTPPPPAPVPGPPFVSAGAPPGANTFIPTRGGYTLAPPAMQGGRAENPTANFDTLRSLKAMVDKDAPMPVSIVDKKSPSTDPKKLADWRARQDAAVERYGGAQGIHTYADLQAAIGQAQGTVGAQTAPPPPAPGGRKKTSNQSEGGIDVDKVLNFLQQGAQPAAPAR